MWPFIRRAQKIYELRRRMIARQYPRFTKITPFLTKSSNLSLLAFFSGMWKTKCCCKLLLFCKHQRPLSCLGWKLNARWVNTFARNTLIFWRRGFEPSRSTWFLWVRNHLMYTRFYPSEFEEVYHRLEYFLVYQPTHLAPKCGRWHLYLKYEVSLPMFTV